MHQVLIATKPVTAGKNATLIFDDGQGSLHSYALRKGEAISLSVLATEKKFCQGWYDIELHQNFSCGGRAVVDAKFDSCYDCRSRTGFNPGFYNSATISPKQAEYNSRPHTVYAAYFGNGLYKAGIFSDSRGLDRIYEQGAIYYAIAERAKDAYDAHALEERLIGQGLRNSVSKGQKQASYERLSELDDLSSRQAFKDKLATLELPRDLLISTTLDVFFFGDRPTQIITTVKDTNISGNIKGLVGSYLVVENNDRLFGVWLSKLCGYKVEVGQDLKAMDAGPVQHSLF